MHTSGTLSLSTRGEAVNRFLEPHPVPGNKSPARDRASSTGGYTSSLNDARQCAGGGVGFLRSPRLEKGRGRVVLAGRKREAWNKISPLLPPTYSKRGLRVLRAVARRTRGCLPICTPSTAGAATRPGLGSCWAGRPRSRRPSDRSSPLGRLPARTERHALAVGQDVRAVPGQ
jgi:hypothetical protein